MTETIKTNYLFIINNSPYGNERPYNALRLALNLVKREDASVRVFYSATASIAPSRDRRRPKDITMSTAC